MTPIRDLAFDAVAQHSQKIVLAALLTVLLTVGAADEAVAHSPAGNPVSGCENGADVVAERNHNCHDSTLS
ncbi:hypothetical protein [Halorientalis sp.]|jgi:hypothetical protein|uniref:hypothetical protein n=1 Tax=Halorientalis sp. TaxID=1931229 RepID=UPI00262BEBC2|nr:hypothetical protein [Halorientalis sp.]